MPSFFQGHGQLLSRRQSHFDAERVVENEGLLALLPVEKAGDAVVLAGCDASADLNVSDDVRLLVLEGLEEFLVVARRKVLQRLVIECIGPRHLVARELGLQLCSFNERIHRFLCFVGFLQGEVVIAVSWVEVEDLASPAVLPDWAKDAIEVTDAPAYGNYDLALKKSHKT